MTALILTPDHLLTLKRAVRDSLPGIRSGHLSEALAAALGRSTHAALLADAAARAQDPEIVLLDDDAFFGRLAELGSDVTAPLDGLPLFEFLPLAEDGKILIKTAPSSADEIHYRSKRARAWRNAMIAAINAAIRRGVISLRPSDNRWPGWPSDYDAQQRGDGTRNTTFRFEIAGVPAFCYLGDAGFDELKVHVALWPSSEAERWIDVAMAGFRAGDVVAEGWLERRNGAWLQTSKRLFRCRRHRLETVASMDLRPLGYGDRGGVIL